ncbi:TPR repeat protein [Kwoniella heveanensis CBS 569]|nr:TPR repeat protein [Kwoniella heveanensis CBS 569]
MPSISEINDLEPAPAHATVGNASSSKHDDLLDKLISAYPSSSTVPPASGVGPSAPGKKEVTYEDFQRVLDSTPLFMRETPKEGETSDVLEALRTLVFEGEGDEIATNCKNHGNELHSQKSFSEAIKAYTSGLEAHPSDQSLRISLLNNRAACHLLLKNHRSVLQDTGVVIALYAGAGAGEPSQKLPTDKALVKAMFRAAQSLVALERWKEASDVVERGKECAGQVKGEDEKPWIKLADDITKGIRRDNDRAERIRKEKLDKLALRKAVDARGLIVVDTSSPPDNPHPLHFDPDSLPNLNADAEAGYIAPSPETPLIFPVFLLYPSYGQSDFITHFHENTSFEDQLNVMFPSASNPQVPYADWDTKREYNVSNLVVYVETAEKRLLKVGKELTLREILRKAKRDAKGDVKKDGVVLRDGLMSFVVLVKGAQEKAWIEDFKAKRDANK